MSEIRHRHRILEAIDQLRRRKARPDVNRICSFMFRRFSVSCGETKSDLQKLIDAEIVIKVDYKGNTSYRNAAKWAMLPNYKSKQELDSTNTSSILSSAVAELIVLEPDYLDIGVPALELEKHLLRRDSKRFTKKNLENILRREIDNGTLVKLENGNYFLGEHSNATKQNNSSQSNINTSQKSANKPPVSSKPKTKKLKPNKPLEAPPSTPSSVEIRAGDTNSNLEERKEEQKEKMEENGTNSNSNTANSENVGFRVGGRQKRAKVMFDPSDNNLPKVSRKRAPGRQAVNAAGKHVSPINRSTGCTNIGAINNNSPSINRAVVTPVTNSPSVSVSVTSPITAIKSFHNLTPTGFSTPTTPISIAVNPSVCCLCHSYGIRIKGVPERLITCADCASSKAHPSCIESKREGASRNKNGLWHCVSCKRCSVCNESGKVGKIAICSSCFDAYHYICHSPHIPLNLTEIDKWKCLKCSSMLSSLASSATNNISSTTVTVINNNNSNNYNINNSTNSNNNNNSIINNDDDNNRCTTDVKENEDIKPPLPILAPPPPPLCINNLPSESHVVTTSSCIVKSNNNINISNCNSSNKEISIDSSASSTVVVTSSLVTPDTSVQSTVCNSQPSPICVITTVSVTPVTCVATTTCTPILNSVSSTSAVSSNHVSMEIEEIEDVKDVKPVIPNDVKESIQRTFTLPLNNNVINSRLIPHEKCLVPPSCLQDPFDGYPIDETIPDASLWTPQDVFQYFIKYFDSDTAKIFKDQEIDGQSLLLMKRSDVLTGLCLKLGPALKVYSHVKKLQIRRSHPKLLWS